MKQQTAVEYLIEQMKNGNFESYKTKNKWIINYQAGEPNPLQLAKAMEEQQITDAFDAGTVDNNLIGNEYYKETYKK